MAHYLLDCILYSPVDPVRPRHAAQHWVTARRENGSEKHARSRH